MKEQHISIFDNRVLSKADAICFCSNGITKSNDELVMGAGIAKLFAQQFPKIPAFFGKKILAGGNHCYVYTDNKPVIINFPTKNDWRDNSILDLIAQSARELMVIIEENNFQKVGLPRPGCANGGLNWDIVKARISPILDDRVIILTF